MEAIVSPVKCSSTLYPVRRWLKIFQLLGGLPLRIENMEATIFKNSTLYSAIFFMKMMFIFASSVFSQVIVNFVILGYDEFEKAIKDLKITQTEVISYYVTIVPQLCGLIINFYILKRFGPDLTNFCQTMKAFVSVPVDTDYLEKYTRRNKRRVVKYIIVSGFGIVAAGITQIYVNSGMEDAFGLKVFVIALQITVNTFVQIPASTLVVHLMVCQSIIHLTALASSLHDVAKDKANFYGHEKRQKSKAEDTAKWMIESTFQLCELITRANATFGKLIFVEVGILMINIVITVFLASSLITSFKLDVFPNALFFNGINQVCSATVFLLRMYGLTSTGEALAAKLLELRVDLKLFGISHFNDMNDQSIFAFDAMLDRLRGLDAPIRPLNGFNLNLSSALTVLGLLITYIVVLFQFKADELANSN